MGSREDTCDDGPQQRTRDRSPQPYHLQAVSQSLFDGNQVRHRAGDTSTPYSRRASRSTANVSESGTEADDEKSNLLKALPPSTHKPRKGLRGSATPLLTPSQLDREARRVSKDYFDHDSDKANVFEQERRSFNEKQRAERIRRVCEAALLGAIGLAVAYGSRVWRHHGLYHLLQVISQLAPIAALILVYPLRLVSVEHRAGHLHIWSRFHIPPSFDPANVLYPAFLPVLVAFTSVQRSPQLILPSLVLGLASLPSRLFPEWSRQTVVNPLHWFVSLSPLFTSRLLDFLVRKFPAYARMLRGPDVLGKLAAEKTTLLFPLHQALFVVLHYFTTTSLLPAEKQLFATALIMLLCFAYTPQSMILSSVLWTGGLGCFLLSLHLLRWNVAISRIPTWKVRPRSKGDSSASAFAVIFRDGLKHLQSATGMKHRLENIDDSEDDDVYSPLPMSAGNALSADESISSGTLTNNMPSPQPQDGTEAILARRSTVPAAQMSHTISQRTGHTHLGVHSSKRAHHDWRSRLSVDMIQGRKQMYALCWYVGLLAIIALPVRLEIGHKALSGRDPVLWAVDYMFGDAQWPMQMLVALQKGVPLYRAAISGHISVLALRLQIGTPNVRLLFIVYWVMVLALGLSAQSVLTRRIEIDTRRKIFHGVLVSMLLPTIFIDPCFCGLTLTLSLGVISILELVRAGQVWPLGKVLSQFLEPYVDGRDLKGPIVISHFFLLIGCAIPLWLSLSNIGRAPEGQMADWELESDTREVAMVSGVVCVGMGDAAASLVGRRFGRHKWPWIGGKSLEGSAAFAIAVTIGLLGAKVWLHVGGWADAVNAGTTGSYSTALVAAKSLVAASGASFMEAVLTGANDNVVVPVALWLLVKGLKI